MEGQMQGAGEGGEVGLRRDGSGQGRTERWAQGREAMERREVARGRDGLGQRDGLAGAGRGQRWRGGRREEVRAGGVRRDGMQECLLRRAGSPWRGGRGDATEVGTGLRADGGVGPGTGRRGARGGAVPGGGGNAAT